MNEFEKGLLRYFDEPQLSKIQQHRIGIAGAGGLGSNIAVCLVRSGFKNFEIIDNDVVEASNLNRQQYFLEDIGKPKVLALKERLLRINTDLQIECLQERIIKDNCSRFFKDTAVLLEAFDGVAAKKLILEEYGNSEKIIICGSGMAGFSNDSEIKIRKISDKHFLVGDGVSSIKEAPPLAPRVMACASLMASVCLECVIKGDAVQ
jgi:sulfur carrier protein ThiS adenylyltransferase